MRSPARASTRALNTRARQNPTRMAFERCIADLEGGSAGFAFASGMAATATVLDCLEKNSHVVVGDDVYGGTRRLFDLVRRQSAGIEATYVDLSDAEALEWRDAS